MALVKRILQSNKLLWAIFGNDEDPEPPAWFMPNRNENLREFMWFFVRNPFHNFDTRVAGTFKYPSEWRVWHSKRSWNLILPFFSYRGKKWEGYIGWRPKVLEDGSMVQMFGFALRRRKDA